VPDPTKWTYDYGGGGWGNQELESYTPRTANAEQRGGYLVITARKEDYTGGDGIPRQYTSARLKTQGRFAQAYGRFEARMQLPVGKGIWPAFWMLGSNIDSVGWPKSGEMDPMECIGDPLMIHSGIHGPTTSGGDAGVGAWFQVPSGSDVDKGFHIYAVEWQPNDVRFYFDDHLIAEYTPKDMPAGMTWVFDHPFFILLNVAVGGNWPGSPAANAVFPQQMLVDYMRVYQPQ